MLVCGNNEQEDCNYLQDDYDILYNTSLNLYTACASQLDHTRELYDNEVMVTDECMEKLEMCESNTTNVINSVNYTNQIKILKHNVELESSILLLKKSVANLEEKKNVAYALIEDYKEEILKLKNNINDTTYQLYEVDENWRRCKEDIQNQVKNYKKIFTNLNACLEKEEEVQEQKNKYVISLTTCKKNNRKLKKKTCSL